MKINIENYDSMTPEEKVAAIEAYEPDMSGFVPKSALDKAASEAASYKRQLREKQTEEEAKAAKEAEERAALVARVQELENERSISLYERAYLALGYDEKSAKAGATALVKGDMDAVFAGFRAHMEGREKALRAELLKQTPQPVAGNADKGMRKEDFVKLTLAEQAKYASEHPEVYQEMFGGN